MNTFYIQWIHDQGVNVCMYHTTQGEQINDILLVLCCGPCTLSQETLVSYLRKWTSIALFAYIQNWGLYLQESIAILLIMNFSDTCIPALQLAKGSLEFYSQTHTHTLHVCVTIPFSVTVAVASDKATCNVALHWAMAQYTISNSHAFVKLLHITWRVCWYMIWVCWLKVKWSFACTGFH